jgi:hypothetical protein
VRNGSRTVDAMSNDDEFRVFECECLCFERVMVVFGVLNKGQGAG